MICVTSVEVALPLGQLNPDGHQHSRLQYSGCAQLQELEFRSVTAWAFFLNAPDKTTVPSRVNRFYGEI